MNLEFYFKLYAISLLYLFIWVSSGQVVGGSSNAIGFDITPKKCLNIFNVF